LKNLYVELVYIAQILIELESHWRSKKTNIHVNKPLFKICNYLCHNWIASCFVIKIILCKWNLGFWIGDVRNVYGTMHIW
jgi:hypothetical protein